MNAIHCSLLSCLALTACAGGAPVRPAPPPEITLSLVGTTDLHGHVEPTRFTVKDAAGAAHEVTRGGLPLFASYLANLRRAQPVALVDAGDLFQGTLISNLGEGQVVIDAYNALGYTAASIGNHEFDYGPVGPRAVPKAGTDDDPTGALKARIAAARFPFLGANVLDAQSGRPVTWPNTSPSKLVNVGGVPLGLIGATSEDTPHTTNAMNLRGLTIGSVVAAAREQAPLLRQQGAAAVILVVHEGGNCSSFANPRDLTPCQGRDARVLDIARALEGQVDAVVGGHSHAGVAHFVGRVPVIQAFTGGKVFGRIDLTFRRTDAAGPAAGGAPGYSLLAERTRIFPPQEICDVALRGPATAPATAPGSAARPAGQLCDTKTLAGADFVPARYEGAAVQPDAAIAALLAPHAQVAAARRAESLGVSLAEKLPRSYRNEAPLSQALADLIREGAALQTGKPVDIGLQNGGGVRADLPTGELTYGQVYEVLPFDNRLAVVELTGAQLAELFRRNLQSSAGVLVPSGIRVQARCAGTELQVVLTDLAGRPQPPERRYRVATSDFLASGGDNFGALVGALPREAVHFYDEAPPLRELVIDALRKRGFPARDTARLGLPMPRPVRCGAPPESASPAQSPSSND